MKLNPDCTRDILFIVEKYSDFDHTCDEKDFVASDIFQKYSKNEVLYHIREAEMANLIYGFKPFYAGFLIEDLTPEGHEFLNDIRQDTNWNKTKEIASKVGSFSLDALKSIATGVVTASINKYLGGM